jgi:D-beta-D-heptose 7-phosphate kinase / D-beta-D-heptose 1-phosphate adenosyltransferase
MHSMRCSVEQPLSESNSVSHVQSRSGLASLLPIIDRYVGLRVWVIGDLMLDEYVTGQVERISPEAPVPVVRVTGTEHRLGGAANVARQVAALGAHVSLAGLIGPDAAGDDLLRLCAEAAIDTHAVVKTSVRRTTRKLRVVGHSQQLLRLDWEDAQSCLPDSIDDMVARLESGGTPDVIILSDYAKGALTDGVIARVMRLRSVIGRAPILVDPKHRDFRRYYGATTITPNLKELEAAASQALSPTDTDTVAAAARALAHDASAESIVVTLGEHGMLVVPAQGPETHIPAARRAVYDVTGAGDTAIAVLALSLATGAPLVDSARVANAAAGVAVGEVGAVAVTASSIRSAITDIPASKVLGRQELAVKAAAWRKAGKRVVFTNGCFDLLHAGHVSLLHQAATLGDVLVVAINSDASVRRLKGPQRPVVPEVDRSALLAALACVDAVTVFDEDTPLETLLALRPQVLVKGGDYRIQDVVGREVVETDGGRVVLIPLLPEKSTTALVERIRGQRQ